MEEWGRSGAGMGGKIHDGMVARVVRTACTQRTRAGWGRGHCCCALGRAPKSARLTPVNITGCKLKPTPANHPRPPRRAAFGELLSEPKHRRSDQRMKIFDRLITDKQFVAHP